MRPRLQHLTREQWLPFELSEVFPFFSNAENLEQLTPPWVGFKILSPLPIAMHEGALIDYKIRLRGIPLLWRTKITVWEPPYRFVDEQIRGPYNIWRHEHRFEESNGGTRVIDNIDYAVPLSWLPGADIVQQLFVKPDLDKIFAFRREALRTHFKLKQVTS